MKKYWPILLLRLSLVSVFSYFGYQAIFDPASAAALISPNILDLMPIPVETFVLITGFINCVIALALFVGFWIDIAGWVGAIFVAIILLSRFDLAQWPNETDVFNILVIAACLVVARSNHNIALQPSMRRSIGWQFLVFAGAMIAFTIYILTQKF